jgi:glycosyltransferase involved in cell wall biosynthesis
MTSSACGGAANAIIDVKVDLHVHSSFSDKPYSWLLQAIEAAECYTSPRKVYELATARGMNLVTICDHDSIDGALELRALYPNTFISEEVSARFPEDGCVMHTIALDIDEGQHAEIQRLRRNIYELTTYLHQQEIAFFLCHPLSQVNRRLDANHIRRCLLMFPALELRNGTRDGAHEQALLRILASLTPQTLASWAEEFPLVPFLNRDGLYAFVGGSDDHAGLSIARAFTTYRGACSGAGLREALRGRRTDVAGEAATPEVLSHNVYGVMAGYISSSGQLASGPDGAQPGSSPALGRALDGFGRVLEDSGIELDLPGLLREGHGDAAQGALRQALETVLVRSGRTSLASLMENLSQARPADLADGLAEVIKCAMLGVPYLAGGRAFAHDRRAARDFAQHLGVAFERPSAPRVAVLTDTLDEVNGVALGLRRLSTQARRAGLDLRLLGIGAADQDHLTVDSEGIVRLPTLLRHRLAAYPQMTFGLPHLPALLHYLIDQRIELIQCSTPGPVGLMGLMAGRLAAVPVIGQYHTDLPEYATAILGDPVVGALVGRYVGWFYGALDRVLVPSRTVADRLRALNVPNERLVPVPRGIDLDLFSPHRRSDQAFEDFGLNGEPKVLYVGRLSREKGLDALIDAFCMLAEELPAARLVMVGAGPYGRELERRAHRSGRVVFTGELTGERLARVYASSDVFVSPSETETFGNAVVEAQAAGVPVVVASRGAARENIVEDVTGLVVDVRKPEQISAALYRLLSEPDLRRRMGDEAFRFARRYDLGAAARETFDIYARLAHNVVA